MRTLKQLLLQFKLKWNFLGKQEKQYREKKVGDKVLFTGKSNDWSFDDSAVDSYISASEGFLKTGETYTIREISHGDYSMHIRLVGGNDEWITSAFFEIVNE
jgi:hypothetical protein